MAHSVDGFDLRFTGRTSWKAERRLRGKLIDVVPVTWTKGWLKTPKGVFIQVWFRNETDLLEYNSRPEPFVIAVAKAKNYNRFPHEFEQFTALFQVKATGNTMSEKSIETLMLDRIRAT
jgi:hypothetical protein